MTLCPCDAAAPLGLTPIAPGLSILPRQIGMFSHFRADFLTRIRAHPALSAWRARDAEDFGLLLLESWAYVADVTAFYTAEHAQDLYLTTARGDLALRRLVALIDHVPRPAVASEAVLAALLDGSDLLTAKAGAGFLSDAILDTPPQVFELTSDTILDPLRNAWTLVPPRDPTYRREALLIDPATRNMAEGTLIVIDAGATLRRAFTVKALTPETGLDGASYLRLEVNEPTLLPTGPLTVDGVKLWAFAQTAPLASTSGSRVILSGHYPQLRKGDLVVVEDTQLDNPAVPQVFTVTSATIGFAADIATNVPGPPQTTVVLSASATIAADTARLHFGRVRAGRLAAPSKPTITGLDLLTPLALKSPVLPPLTGGAGEVLVKGAGDLGLRVPGDANIDPSGRGTLQPTASFAGDPITLRLPVQAHGNILRVTRGKSVDEVLGSGQGPGVPFQTFSLTKSPLTYLHDPAAKGGRSSTLRLWIDGIAWAEVPSLFTSGPDDRVYTVRLDAKGKATITTGGAGFGKPAPLGVQNVYASYRYGAGDPLPAANQLRQVSGSIPGLRRVFNVTPGFGGAPADRPEDIRFNAPATSATFDRAISAADFAALARDWGALAAVAVTEWVPGALREGVVVRTIFDGTASPEDLTALTAHLVARTAEATPVRVVAAQKVGGTLTLAYRCDADANPAEVKAALTTAMTDPFTGLLAPRRAAVGGPVFRSAILGVAGQVPGIASLLSLNLDGSPMPLRLGLPAQGYFAPDFVAEEVTS